MYAGLICSLSQHCPRPHQCMSALSVKRKHFRSNTKADLCSAFYLLWNIQQGQPATGYGQLRFPWSRGTSVGAFSFVTLSLPHAIHPTQTECNCHPSNTDNSHWQEHELTSRLGQTRQKTGKHNSFLCSPPPHLPIVSCGCSGESSTLISVYNNG